jgi:hypothetical protein
LVPELPVSRVRAASKSPSSCCAVQYLRMSTKVSFVFTVFQLAFAPSQPSLAWACTLHLPVIIASIRVDTSARPGPRGLRECDESWMGSLDGQDGDGIMDGRDQNTKSIMGHGTGFVLYYSYSLPFQVRFLWCPGVCCTGVTVSLILFWSHR